VEERELNLPWLGGTASRIRGVRGGMGGVGEGGGEGGRGSGGGRGKTRRADDRRVAGRSGF